MGHTETINLKSKFKARSGGELQEDGKKKREVGVGR